MAEQLGSTGTDRPPPVVDDRGHIGFDALYQASYPRLVAQVHAYLSDRSEAEEIVQEAFVRAWQRWSRVTRLDDPAAWVRRVAWNLATSRLRRLAMAARVHRRPLMSVTRPPDPDHVALVTALRELPERHRLAVVLHYLADLSVAQIAADLDVPAGTVQSWLHRGRARLAKLLADPSVRPPAGRRPSAQGGDRHV